MTATRFLCGGGLQPAGAGGLKPAPTWGRRFAFFLFFVAVSASAATHYAGRPLADALRDLEAKGLRLIYSSDVVRPEMLVGAEPRAGEPRRVLDELLHEHHLKAVDGPRGSLVIVRDEQKPATVLEKIVVTPSRFTMLAAEPQQKQFLSRDEVRAIPHLSDDLYRAIVRVPGLTASDVSARFNIRGGQEDETETLVDGAEIYDPFHVKDLFRAFSTIDAEAVGAVDVLTGGFPVQYGGRMSGVVEVTSLAPSETRHTEIGISLLNTRLLSSGTFDGGRAEWLVSVRRGYLHELLRLFTDNSETINPNYYDLLGKVQLSIGENNVLSLHALLSGDRLRILELGANAHASYGDNYVWTDLRTAVTPRLYAQTVLSAARVSTSRVGTFGDARSDDEGAVADHHSFALATLKHDASYDLSPRNVLKGGLTLKRETARYHYDADAITRASLLHVNEPPITTARHTNLRLSGNDVAAYVADRIAVSDRLVVEAGARIDRQSYAPDSTHVAPRLNVAVQLNDRATLRAAWGRFYQPQALHELQVEDGDTSIAGAERADHALASIDYAFPSGYSTRFELYEKRYSDVRPRFENLFDRIILFPEVRGDRVLIAAESGRARGGEILVRTPAAAPLSGWISYVRATAVDRIDGRDVPRAWDQRDSLTLNVNWRPGTLWNFDLAGVYHSGWPTTGLRGVIVDNVFHTVAGPIRGERFPAYRRVDIRASRAVPTRRGGLSFFLELFNALNNSNVTRVDGYTFTGTANAIHAERQTESIVGIVPSFGFTYAF